jgi:hypothetical protein
MAVMTTSTLVMAVMGALSLVSVADAAAQPRWGREQVPQAGACFYEDKNFEGRYFCVAPGEEVRQVPNDMRGRISSVRMVGPHEVTVFQDNDMRGRSTHLVGDVPDLRREGWNDQISSIVVAAAGRPYGTSGVYDHDRGREHGAWEEGRAPAWGSEAVPREGACFYEDRDFHGRYFCVPRGAAYTSLPGGLNDRIASVRVFHADVHIWTDQDFHGRSRRFTRDERDLHGDWRGVVSSVQVR